MRGMKDNLGFLLGDAARLIRRAFDEKARTIGVTRPQWRVMTMLSRNAGISQGALADLLEVEPMSLSRMIDRMAGAGLVERRANPDDRRAWQLYLTDDAEPLLGQLRALADDLFVEAMAGLSAGDVEHMHEMLQVIRGNLGRTPERAMETIHG